MHTENSSNPAPEPAPLDPKAERRARKEAALDQMFGKNRKEYMGNIWGWRFSIISLIGLLLIGGFAILGVKMGWINLEEQLPRVEKKK